MNTSSQQMNNVTITEDQRQALQTLIEDVIEYLEGTPQDTTDFNTALVGGAVRDVLHSADPTDINDWDFVVIGETKESMVDRGFTEIPASSFPVFHDANGEEYALARTETKAGFGYKGFELDEIENVPLHKDLERRDFTMNALAVETLGYARPFEWYEAPDDSECTRLETKYGDRFLSDLFGGIEDLESGTIRHISDESATDPLRVVRGARYAARYETESGDNFTIAPKTKRLMQTMAPELNLTSKDRIGGEIEKAMEQAINPRVFWEVLSDVGALAVLAPRLDRARIVPAGPDKFHREGSTFEHSMIVLEEMHSICEKQDITGIDRVRRFMLAITHDLGKVAIADNKGGLHGEDPPQRFGGHAQVGTATVEQFGNSLGLDNHIISTMQDGSEEHMRIHDLPTEWSAEKILNFVSKYTYNDGYNKPYGATLDELIDLAHADTRGRFQNIDVFDNESEYEHVETAPEGAAKAVFNRSLFTETISMAKEAISKVNGYSVMEDELQSAGEDVEDIAKKNIAPELARNEDCRSPGEWIGDELTQRRANEFYSLSQTDQQPNK